MSPPARRRVALASTIAAAFVLATACASSDKSTNASGPIKVGFIDSLTGATAGAGTADLCGAQIAVNAINSKGGVNGSKLSLVTADDQSTPAVAAQQAQKLTSQGIKIFAGGSTSSDILAALPYLKKSNALFLGGTTKTSDVLDFYNNILRVNSSSEQDMSWLAGYLNKNAKPGNLVLVGLSGTFTQGEFDNLKAHIDNSKFPNIVELLAPDDTTDWSSYISKAQSAHPSVIVNVIFGTAQPVSWYKAAYSAGLRVKQFGAPGILSSTVISEAGAQATSGLVAADTWVTYIKGKGETQLENDYKAQLSKSGACAGKPLDVEGKQMETTYSQLEILKDGIEASKSEDPTAIKKAVLKGTWTLPSGDTIFDSHGQASQHYYLYNVRNGKEVPATNAK